MDKKGFTLVELLTVIVLLAIIAAITTPVIINVINDSRENAYEEQVRLITSAAERWGTENMTYLNGKGSCYLSAEKLSEEGYLSAEKIINPKKPSENMGVVEITVNNGKYEYVYKETSETVSCLPN